MRRRYVFPNPRITPRFASGAEFPIKGAHWAARLPLGARRTVPDRAHSATWAPGSCSVGHHAVEVIGQAERVDDANLAGLDAVEHQLAGAVA